MGIHHRIVGIPMPKLKTRPSIVRNNDKSESSRSLFVTNPHMPLAPVLLNDAVCFVFRS
jgi:hypothetical protein